MPEIITLFQQNSTLFVTCFSLFGLIIGSFLNVVIYRLPKMMEQDWRQQCQELCNPDTKSNTVSVKYNLITPRSACPNCNKLISGIENIPVLSYLFLKGKCKECNSLISPRYPAVELISALLLGLIASKFGFSTTTLAASLFALSLLTLACIDLDTHLLPDDITLPLLWIGLIFNLDHGFTDLQTAVIGAAVGYLILWIVFWTFKLLTGKEGMGYGDFKMLAAIGAWFGWTMIPAVILLASLIGSIVGISMIVFAKQGKNIPIPFGPYLAIGGMASLFWGKQLSQLYFGG